MMYMTIRDKRYTLEEQINFFYDDPYFYRKFN